MNKLLIFASVLSLSLPISQAYAESPIFMGSVKNFFSSKTSNESANKPVSLRSKSKTTSAKTSNGKADYGGSPSERFKKASASRKMTLSKRRAKAKERHEAKMAASKLENLRQQQLAQYNAQNNNGGKRFAQPVGTTQTVATNRPTQRVVVRNKPKEAGGTSILTPIFKNFR